MEENVSMEAAVAKMDKADTLRAGDVVTGKVMSVNHDEVIVNLDYMADGILTKEEIEGGETSQFAEGDAITVYVLKVNDGEGSVSLSLKRAEAEMVWQEFQTLLDEKTTFSLKIKEAVKGGLVGIYKSARVFIPASQVALHFVEDLSAYAGSSLDVKLIEFDPEKKRVVASRRVIEEKERSKRKEETLSKLSEGDKLTGKVVRLANYGAFVDLGDVDGLVHISQMSWKHVKHPSDIVKEGDVVDVEVLSVDRETEKISLKLANIQENPWKNILDHYQINDIVSGKVKRTTSFGAFVEVEEGVEGLVHISEISEEHIANTSDVLSEGDEVEVMVLNIDAEAQKMSLSIKAVKEADAVSYEPIEEETVSAPTLSDLFGDKLKNLKL